MYTGFESALAPLYPKGLTPDEADEWTHLEVRIDGAVKLKVSYRANDLVLLSYVLGHWERRFGANLAGDITVLLPASLQNHGALPIGLRQAGTE